MGLKAFYPGPVLYYMYKVYGDQQFYAKNFKSHDNKLYLYMYICMTNSFHLHFCVLAFIVFAKYICLHSFISLTYKRGSLICSRVCVEEKAGQGIDHTCII